MKGHRRISDTELRAQLQRRAPDDPERSEWWRELFVSGVRATTDAGQPPASGSFLPAISSLVAGLALLTVIVLAMPRTQPGGGPSTSPSVASASPVIAEGPTSVATPASPTTAAPRLVPARGTDGLDCAAEPAQTSEVHATIHDELGLVDSCEGINPGRDMEAPVSNPDGDLRVLQLNWTGRTCDADPDITITSLGDGISVHVVFFQKTCRALPGRHSLLLHLRGEVSANSVIALIDRHTQPEATP